MTFALGTTTGAGTITIVAGSNRATGVGTNFVAANVRAIVVVGTQWGVIRTVNNTLSIVFDRPFETAVSGAAYQISANIPIITQTAPDTDATIVASLTGVPGITRSVNTWTIHSASLITINCVINRLTNVFRFVDTASVLTASTTVSAFLCNGFNNSVAQTLNGYSYKSSHSSIIFDVAIPAIASHSTGGLMGTTLGSISAVIEGDIEYTNTLGNSVLTFGFLQAITWQNGGFLNRSAVGNNILAYVPFATGGLTINNWTTVGTTLRVADNPLSINNYAAIAGPQALNINTSSPINNAQYVGLQSLGNTTSIRTAAASFKYFQLINYSDTRLVPNANLASNTGSQFLIVNQLSLSATGASGAVQDVKFWAQDSDNGARYTANYGAGQAYEIATTGNLTYTATTAASGIAPTLNMISVVYYQPTASTTTIDYRGNNGAQDFNIYSCSYNHVLSNSPTALWPLNSGVYGGASVRNQGFVLLQDTSITQTTMATVAAYTTLSTNAELYDYAKYHLYTNFAGQTATYVTGTGDAGSYNIIINTAAAAVFNFTGSSIVIKTSSFDGDLTTSGSLILAASSVVTNGTFSTPNIIQDIPTALTSVVATGNLNYNTNTPITVTFTDCDIQGTVTNTGSALVSIIKVNSTIGTLGTNVTAAQFAPIAAPNLITNTAVRLYDITHDEELYNDKILSPGFLYNLDWTESTTVVMSATYCEGLYAKEYLRLTGVVGEQGLTFLDSQSNKAVYATAGIDGDTVTEFEWDEGNIQVDIDDADNKTTIQRLGAWYQNYITTPEGIVNALGAIDWESINSIKIISNMVGMKLDNIKSTPLLISGGRLYRDDGETIIAATSNSIQLDYEPVYAAPDLNSKLNEILKWAKLDALNNPNL